MSRCGPGPVCLPAKWLHLFFFFPPPCMLCSQIGRWRRASSPTCDLLTQSEKRLLSLFSLHWPLHITGAFMQTFIYFLHAISQPRTRKEVAANLTESNDMHCDCQCCLLFSACFGWPFSFPACIAWMKNLHGHMFPFACATHLSRWLSRMCGVVDSVWALWCSFALTVRRSWLEPVFSHTMCKKPAGGLMRLELNCDIN